MRIVIFKALAIWATEASPAAPVFKHPRPLHPPFPLLTAAASLSPLILKVDLDSVPSTSTGGDLQKLHH